MDVARLRRPLMSLKSVTYVLKPRQPWPLTPAPR